MTDGLFVPLKAKNEDFRRRVSELDRDHLKEFKKVRNEIKRKIEVIHKLRRKSRKCDNGGELVNQIEQQTRELYIKYRVLEEQERQAVRRINIEERAQVAELSYLSNSKILFAVLWFCCLPKASAIGGADRNVRD